MICKAKSSDYWTFVVQRQDFPYTTFSFVPWPSTALPRRWRNARYF